MKPQILLSGAGSRPEANKIRPMPLPSIPMTPLPGDKQPGTSKPVQLLNPLSQFIDLEAEVRRCSTIEELRFVIVNSSRKISQFEQGFLAEPDLTGVWRITRCSGTSKFDSQAPLIKSVSAWLKHHEHKILLDRGEPRIANAASESANWNLSAQDLFAPHVMCIPIKSRAGVPLATLIASRVENWRPNNSAMLLPLADVYSHAWEALAGQTKSVGSKLRSRISRSKLLTISLASTLSIMLMPVQMSALAPADVVSANPMLVTSPIDGVVADILAPPGAEVEIGTPIVRLEDVKLRNEVEIAKRNLGVAEARYFKVVQAATAAQKDLQDLATAKTEYDLAKAELEYAAELLSRTEIKAERKGLLIYSSKSEWIGKPVATGERIMEIGNPESPELKIELPASDSLALKPGGRVSLFLDDEPMRAIAATITQMSYRPTHTAEQQLVFKIRAKFDGVKPRRLGLHGVARVSGESVPLWFYLFRRPITMLRQRVGL